MKEGNNRSTWKFWAGLFAGIAAGLYLNSNQGRRLRQESNKKLNTWSQDVSDRTRNELDQFSEKATDAIENSKEYADQARNSLKENIEKASRTAEEWVDKTEQNYERAADWANEKLKKNGDKK